MMISKENCIATILDKFPDFSERLDLHKKYWQEEETGLWSDLSEFSIYVIELLENNETQKEKVEKVFVFLEYLLTCGDSEVQNAIATCVLENILNRTPDIISPKKFVPYLGKNSKDYCRAWDRFTGLETEGLWQ